MVNGGGARVCMTVAGVEHHISDRDHGGVDDGEEINIIEYGFF